MLGKYQILTNTHSYLRLFHTVCTSGRRYQILKKGFAPDIYWQVLSPLFTQPSYHETENYWDTKYICYHITLFSQFNALTQNLFNLRDFLSFRWAKQVDKTASSNFDPVIYLSSIKSVFNLSPTSAILYQKLNFNDRLAGPRPCQPVRGGSQ